MLVKPRLDENKRWFREARFGMFVHFGLYSILGRGEWVMYHEKIPRKEYEKLVGRFNPRRFNADQWVEMARRAGARYITMTAKHIDGFCLFDSELTDYKITNTPFGRDLIAELIDACHRRRMRIILYYCQFDWHHPNYAHRRGQFKDIHYKRPGDHPDGPKYMKYYIGQVRELCTKYGRIDGIWFDGTQKSERDWRGKQVYRMINEMQPGAVVNDRSRYGDFFTPERSLAAIAAADGYMVEACQAISRDAWGYAPNAVLFSSPYLIESLVRMSAAGGNYLLNIGPKPDGTLPAEQVQRLEDIGKWLRSHRAAVFGTQGCPLRDESEDMLYTRKGKRLYLHMIHWPEKDAVVLKRLRKRPLRARLLKTKDPLRIEKTGDGVVLRGLPSTPPDPATNAVEMVFDGESSLQPLPRPKPKPATPIAPKGVTTIPPTAAACKGYSPKGGTFGVRAVAKWEGEKATPIEKPVTCIFGWMASEQKASWRLETAGPIRREFLLEMSCPVYYSASTFKGSLAGQKVKGTVPGTKNFAHFKRVSLGVFKLPKGISTLTIAPHQMNFAYVFAGVRRLFVRPVK